jgi:hypothetical protein
MHAGDERAITNIGQVNEKWAARQVSSWTGSSTRRAISQGSVS